MSVFLDTLVFAQRLRASGVSQEHAEAHAEVTRDVVLVNVVSQSDLRGELAQLRAEMRAFEEALVTRVTKLVATMLIGAIGAAGALVALSQNIGKLFGH